MKFKETFRKFLLDVLLQPIFVSSHSNSRWPPQLIGFKKITITHSNEQYLTKKKKLCGSS